MTKGPATLGRRVKRLEDWKDRHSDHQHGRISGRLSDAERRIHELELEVASLSQVVDRLLGARGLVRVEGGPAPPR